MFEDSTFESGGRIKSKIGKYMIPLFIVEGVLLVLLILIPLIYPEALPRAAMQMALVAPRPRRAAPRPAAPPATGSAPGSGEVGDDEQSAHGPHPDSA
jgi:protein TonB